MKLNSESRMIIDEADFCLFDSKLKIPSGGSLVIRFKATTVQKIDNLDAAILTKMGFYTL